MCRIEKLSRADGNEVKKADIVLDEALRIPNAAACSYIWRN